MKFLTYFKKIVNRSNAQPIMLFLTFSMASCSSSTPNITQETFYVFGTSVNVQIIETNSSQSNKAIQQIESDFHQFSTDWHAWEKGGIMGKINDAIAAGKPIVVPQSVKDFIVKSQQLSKASNNLFDPAIGALVNLWGFHSEDWKGPPPSEAKIRAWLKNRPSIQDIHFDGLTLISRNQKVQLDFGGNAKGLALDMAIDSLHASGIKNAIVNIGGDMRIIGNKNPQKHQAWSIGIQNPLNPANVMATVALQGDESIVTSGTYQRFFEWQGKHYNHILNPNTGYPADNFLSVTVIHPDATTADSAATALMVAGPQDWQAIAKQMGIDQAFMIDRTGQHHMTPKMRSRLSLITTK